MRVEVIAAWPHRCVRKRMELPAGAHVEDAIAAAGFASLAEVAGLAVFGQRVTPRHPLVDGDRVELLRGLKVDPKAARRARAQVQRERRSAR
ncbi:MAG: RnfH family protein [Proteobacteria bacterium]|nr:RnfH family protein [Pseudomonadota bacterium]